MCRAVLSVLPALVLTACSRLPAVSPSETISVATWNLEWFFDDQSGDNYSKLARERRAPSREAWEWKRDGVAAAIARLRPTILALQEVENQRVLYYLVTRLRNEYQLEYRIAFVEGADYYTEQDVAVLYRHALVQYGRWERSDAIRDRTEFYDVPKHMFARFQWETDDGPQMLTLVNVHLRASSEGESARRGQARLIRYWIQDAVARGEDVIVTGDFNADQPYGETRANSEIGILRGLDTPSPGDDLVDLHQFIPLASRSTHLIKGKEFDRMLVTASLTADSPGRSDLVFQSAEVRRDVVIRGRGPDEDHRDGLYQIPPRERDLSDHYPVVATFGWK